MESWEEMYETGTVRNGGGVSKNEQKDEIDQNQIQDHRLQAGHQPLTEEMAHVPAITYPRWAWTIANQPWQGPPAPAEPG